jgi:hypothetical protein
VREKNAASAPADKCSRSSLIQRAERLVHDVRAGVDRSWALRATDDALSCWSRPDRLRPGDAAHPMPASCTHLHGTGGRARGSRLSARAWPMGAESRVCSAIVRWGKQGLVLGTTMPGLLRSMWGKRPDIETAVEKNVPARRSSSKPGSQHQARYVLAGSRGLPTGVREIRRVGIIQVERPRRRAWLLSQTTFRTPDGKRAIPYARPTEAARPFHSRSTLAAPLPPAECAMPPVCGIWLRPFETTWQGARPLRGTNPLLSPSDVLAALP